MNRRRSERPLQVDGGPGRGSGVERLRLLAVLVAMAVLMLRSLGDTTLGYPDADRVLMDGVFMHDSMRALPVGRPYEFAVEYYARYPALSIGYRPPFFAFVEGLFHLVFGLHMWSSRLAILGFMLLGVTAWYRIVERTFDRATAFWTSALLATTPFLVQWGWYTMGDLPVLGMALASAASFHAFTRTWKSRHLYAATILACTAVWTKQTAVVLAPWFFLHLLIGGNLRRVLAQRRTWLALLSAAVLLAPLVAITLWLGDQNLAQSVGVGDKSGLLRRFRWVSLSAQWKNLYSHHLTLPTLMLGVVGLGCALRKRDRRALFFVTLILSTYALFTYIIAKNPRYSIFWIPAFCLFAALPIHYLRERRKMRFGCALLLASVVAYQVRAVYRMTPLHASGNDVAAEFVLDRDPKARIFFDGFNNGYFTYFVRTLDPHRRASVLRGDKLLSSSSVTARNQLEVHARSPGDILEIFDEYGVEYIVVERENRFGVEIHGVLRELLATGPFELEKSIPVNSNRSRLRDQDLLIYRYLEPKPQRPATLELRLPIVGETLRVPIR